MREARLWVEQGFQPCIQDTLIEGRLSAAEARDAAHAQSTSGAEARMFLECFMQA